MTFWKLKLFLKKAAFHYLLFKQLSEAGKILFKMSELFLKLIQQLLWVKTSLQTFLRKRARISALETPQLVCPSQKRWQWDTAYKLLELSSSKCQVLSSVIKYLHKICCIMWRCLKLIQFCEMLRKICHTVYLWAWQISRNSRRMLRNKSSCCYLVC